MTEIPMKVNAEDEAYRNSIAPRLCSCGQMLLIKEYNAHLKDGTHNKLMGPKERPLA